MTQSIAVIGQGIPCAPSCSSLELVCGTGIRLARELHLFSLLLAARAAAAEMVEQNVIIVTGFSFRMNHEL